MLRIALIKILELNNKSIEELNNLYKSLKHICIYNRNHLLKMKKNSWPTIMSNISNSFYKITTKQKDKFLFYFLEQFVLFLRLIIFSL